MAIRTVAGRHSVVEALKVRPNKVSKVFVDDKFNSKKWSDDVINLIKKNRIRPTEKKQSFFTKLCQNSQGIACEVTEDPEWINEDAENVFILALDSVEDPHNLGAILRSAWLLGVDGVMVSDRDSASLTPTACKVASGGAEHVPVLRVKNLKQEIDALKQKGFWSYAMTVDQHAQKISEVTKSEKTVLIAGAEEKGIKPSLIKSSDFKVYIPQTEVDASLNVSVSVALGVWSLI
jgi:23S rRNA (guanosine2251-2'-O)-methyltransferase